MQHTIRGPETGPAGRPNAAGTPVPGAGRSVEYMVLRGLLYGLAVVDLGLILDTDPAHKISGFIGLPITLAALLATARR